MENPTLKMREYILQNWINAFGEYKCRKNIMNPCHHANKLNLHSEWSQNFLIMENVIRNYVSLDDC